MWREGLLAQAVLLGRTRGWRSHPQLDRFKGHEDPVAAIGFYILKIHEEAMRRGYRYERGKIVRLVEDVAKIEVTTGQLVYEYGLLMERLSHRDPEMYSELSEREERMVHPRPHPIFEVVEGHIEPWETGYWAERKREAA